MPESMLELNDIFVAVDVSVCSRGCVTVAQDIAERSHAQVRLVHAVPDMMRYFERCLFPYAGLGGEKAAVLADVRAAAQRDVARYHRLKAAVVEGEERDQSRPSSRPGAVDVLIGPGGVSGLVTGRLAETSSELVVVGRSGADAASAGR